MLLRIGLSTEGDLLLGGQIHNRSLGGGWGLGGWGLGGCSTCMYATYIKLMLIQQQKLPPVWQEKPPFSVLKRGGGVA